MNLFEEEFIIKNKQNNSILCDIHFNKSKSKQSILIFSHGFKGFKDFACFNLIATEFAKNDFAFLKFNFSKNGTSIDNPTEFVDLEAFSENTFTQEIDDLGAVIDYVCSDEFYSKFAILVDEIILIGHSKGGGISILKAAEDKRVSKIITLASISQIGRFWNEEMLANWEKTGIRYEYNSRTKQDMPLKYLIYENYIQNKERLDIPNAIQKLQIKYCAIHGNKDETVSIENTDEIKKLNKHIDIQIIEGANHTFGMSHPWTNNNMPIHTQIAIEKALSFLKS